MNNPSGALRPRSFFEILDGSLRHYRARFIPLLMPYLPQTGVMVLLGLITTLMQGSAMTSGSDLDLGAFFGLFGIFGIFWVLFAVAYLMGYAASVFMVASHIDGGEIDPAQAWRLAGGRFWTMLGLGVLTLLAVTAGSILFIIPGIILSIRLLIVYQVHLLEEVSVSESFSRSVDLTKGNFWRGFGFMVFLTVLAGIMSSPSQIAGLIPLFFLNEDGEIGNAVGFYSTMAVSQLVGAALGLVVAPLTTLVFTHFYVDLRVRREGIDFEDRFQRLDRAAASER